MLGLGTHCLGMQGVFPIAYGPLGHGKGGLLDHLVVAQVAQAAGKTPAEVCERYLYCCFVDAQQACLSCVWSTACNSAAT